ncbi:VC0807 family protein [Amycolatopsis sp. SID8362]|uniref:VC0807 family protein n=1 Tax=Amycolatopsis sp. SID8362 TaxID=2690346 RepID=UPI0014152B6F|nr:VC0807 family protein [Amycolatopsis sp. SID8362]
MAGKSSAGLNWFLTITLNIVLPVLTYAALAGQVGEVAALLLSGVWPVVEIGISYARTRHIDELSMITLIALAVSTVASLMFNTPKLLLLRDSALTGLFGFVLLGSLLAPRPLMFYFGRKFATDGTPERVAWWNGLWQFEGFRRGQRMLTVVWGASFLAEAALRIALTYVLPTEVMVVLNSVLPLVVMAALITGTIAYGKRRAAAAQGG